MIHVVPKATWKSITVISIIAVIVAAGLISFIFMDSNKVGMFEDQKRESFNEYSWEEISAMAHEMTLAGNHDGALREAKKNDLLDDNGNLRSDLIKEFTLTDGTVCQAQLVGLYNDPRRNGSGNAGMTFIVTHAVDVSGMNETATNEGGWESSAVRAWANGDFTTMLPDELRNIIVAVNKKTNNVGSTDSPDAVTVTQDYIWLFSLSEIWGESEGNHGFKAVLNEEGSQYDLFTDDVAREKVISAIEGTEKLNWWLRSPNPETTEQFYSQGEGYDTEQNFPLSMMADDKLSIVVGFCL